MQFLVNYEQICSIVMSADTGLVVEMKECDTPHSYTNSVPFEVLLIQLFSTWQNIYKAVFVHRVIQPCIRVSSTRIFRGSVDF